MVLHGLTGPTWSHHCIDLYPFLSLFSLISRPSRPSRAQRSPAELFQVLEGLGRWSLEADVGTESLAVARQLS